MEKGESLCRRTLGRVTVSSNHADRSRRQKSAPSIGKVRNRWDAGSGRTDEKRAGGHTRGSRRCRTPPTNEPTGPSRRYQDAAMDPENQGCPDHAQFTRPARPNQIPVGRRPRSSAPLPPPTPRSWLIVARQARPGCVKPALCRFPVPTPASSCAATPVSSAPAHARSVFHRLLFCA